MLREEVLDGRTNDQSFHFVLHTLSEIDTRDVDRSLIHRVRHIEVVRAFIEFLKESRDLLG